ncbi:hypothetical protein PACTADRAFT_40201 [Pachysolen tannophilus NRRL Y-2460]|uniref:Aldehyde dehydrogenase domain-containing protein n=1 Tax=Pachysolen tannophilus NRRL Y-2460 TaxID=669874 RepID=A0A1E4TYQ4_PACTA|nr:hypothetical protein PACTADRAFT_40201 [Pachysolen tannophilus NRRL Y-2460]
MVLSQINPSNFFISNLSLLDSIWNHVLNSQNLPVEISISFLVTVVLPISFAFYYKLNSNYRLERPVKIELNTPEAAKPHWKGKRLFPVSIRNQDDPNYIQCYCPATGQFLGKYKSFSKEDIDKSINNCQNAQLKWLKTSFQQRRKVLRTLNQFICDHQSEIVRVACRDSGKTMVDASMGEILVTLEKINWILQNGEKSLSISSRPGPSNLFMKYKEAEVRYEPLGVVAALISWNYPFHNLMGPIVASIFTGNGCIIKCSEQVFWSSTYFISIVQAALQKCGHDPNIVQLVCCWPEEADYFTSHPGLSHITFIGSKPVAHKVINAAGKSLTPVVLELGGKDSIIVCDDVKDIESVASIILRGTFQSSGQNCIGIERVIALPRVYDQLVKILSKRIKELRLGSDIDQLEDIDMGAIITDARFDTLEKIISNAVDQGAKLLAGGKKFHHPNYPQGHYFQPTLLVDVDASMDIAQNEIFGPVLTMIKANDVEEAISITNSTEYGLGASVFSNDFKLGNYIANNLVTGNVSINDFATFYLCQLPFGGVKKSGYGKFGGEEGLRGLCNAKSVCYDKYPFIHTTIPPPVDYPIKDEKKAWLFVKSLNKSGYDNSLWERFKAVFTLAKNCS